MDWASRALLAWLLSNTMDVSFCLDALKEALARFGNTIVVHHPAARPPGILRIVRDLEIALLLGVLYERSPGFH
jgi:transposase InsO family protein